MILFDTHCHLDDASFDADRPQVLARARAAGVGPILIPATAAEGWPGLERLCRGEEQLYPALGIHPLYIAGHGPEHLLALEQRLAAGAACAVGECGLDAFREHPDLALQRQIFDAQLALAAHYQLPVIVHARRTVEEALLMVRRYPGLRGVFHSFSGSYQQATRLLELGWRVSFGGPLTYSRATRLRQIAARLPLEALLLESDAPDQPLASHRGMRNEPASLSLLLESLCHLRSESAAEIAAATTANGYALFSRCLPQPAEAAGGGERA